MTACSCVADHNPACRVTHTHHIWPLGMGGPDEPWNRFEACPNLHTSAHQLVRLWGARYDGEPPWWIRRHFNPTARWLAEEGWSRWDRAGRLVDRRMWLYQGAASAFDLTAIARVHVDLLKRVLP